MRVLVGLEMIVEHEVIDQLMCEEAGRPLAWICRLIEGLGREPFPLLRGMVRAGDLRLEDAEGEPLPDWQIARLWREGTPDDPIRVHATRQGIDKI